ncbi:hypothetical protein PUN28_004862 [Cardiocondyla obscurior]|uniref:Uncharacterized protein n=1 Tax=Cardiocondyla obscurior TaxID=286306 RepID=A0AAW2GEM0_9HYME
MYLIPFKRKISKIDSLIMFMHLSCLLNRRLAIAYWKQGTAENSEIGPVVSSRNEHANRVAISMENPLVLNERRRLRPLFHSPSSSSSFLEKLAMMVTVAAP